jgi:hypothetical protein
MSRGEYKRSNYLYDPALLVHVPTGRVVDPNKRDAETCRRHGETAREIAAELRALAARGEAHVTLGREAGRKTWSRLLVTAAVLEELAERDATYAEQIPEAEDWLSGRLAEGLSEIAAHTREELKRTLRAGNPWPK